jgi:cytochrome c peroxidase
VSCVDVNRRNIRAEWQIVKSLSGIVSCTDHLLVLDDDQHRLVSARPIDVAGKYELQILSDITVPKYPVDIAVSDDQSTIAVSSLWSRRLTLLAEDAAGNLQQRHMIDLDFAPRRLKFISGNLLIVADSFGGRLQLVDPAKGQLLTSRNVYGHNIRGIGVNPGNNSLLVTCQTLNSGTFTSYERIFWGVVMQNGLHTIPVASLTAESTTAAAKTAAANEFGDASYGSSYDRSYGSSVGSSNPSGDISYVAHQQYPLGTPSIGSGDPGDLVITNSDTTLLLLSGVNQVAFRTASHLPFERLKTGLRPEAISLNASQSHAVVVNRFDDSLTLISLSGEAPAVETTIPLGTLRPFTLEEQGEQTFYDARVSLDGWYSCHSCHTDGHTNGLLSDTFGDEDRGAPKKVVTLRGVAHSGPWAWNGSKTSMQDQIKTSLIISMQTQLPTEELPIDSLAAYLQTLPSVPSVASARAQELDETTRTRLMSSFQKFGCRDCHANDAFTSDSVFDVGLHDEMGESEFNPPSLLGVSQRAPYFHDGRAASLADVLKSSHHNAELPLKESEIQDMRQLLESL